MKRDDLFTHIDRLLAKYQPLARKQDADRGNVLSMDGARAEAEEFLRSFAGERSAFYKAIAGWSSYWTYGELVSLLSTFREYVESGLLDAVSPERQAQFDAMAEISAQAGALLADSAVHPAAAAMLIGAALEEYLRSWVARLSLQLGQRRQSIQAYAGALRDTGALSKQDVKNITSWAGLRNHAAHGEWEEVKDRREIRIMLEGVDVFMQRYGA